MTALAVLTVRTADFNLELRRDADLKNDSFHHRMSPVQRVTKLLTVKLYF